MAACRQTTTMQTAGLLFEEEQAAEFAKNQTKDDHNHFKEANAIGRLVEPSEQVEQQDSNCIESSQFVEGSGRKTIGNNRHQTAATNFCSQVRRKEQSALFAEEEDDDEEAFIAFCTDSSSVLNSNNSIRHCYVNKLYQPIGSTQQNNFQVGAGEDDDELLLYEELRYIQETSGKSQLVGGKRTPSTTTTSCRKNKKSSGSQLTKILEDDDGDDDEEDEDHHLDHLQLTNIIESFDELSSPLRLDEELLGAGAGNCNGQEATNTCNKPDSTGCQNEVFSPTSSYSSGRLSSLAAFTPPQTHLNNQNCNNLLQFCDGAAETKQQDGQEEQYCGDSTTTSAQLVNNATLCRSQQLRHEDEDENNFHFGCDSQFQTTSEQNKTSELSFQTCFGGWTQPQAEQPISQTDEAVGAKNEQQLGGQNSVHLTKGTKSKTTPPTKKRKVAPTTTTSDAAQQKPQFSSEQEDSLQTQCNLFGSARQLAEEDSLGASGDDCCSSQSSQQPTTSNQGKSRRRVANARERIRMREINLAFVKLKEKLPRDWVRQNLASCDEETSDSANTCKRRADGEKPSQQQAAADSVKLTKIAALRLAKSYIEALSEVLKQSPTCRQAVEYQVEEKELTSQTVSPNQKRTRTLSPKKKNSATRNRQSPVKGISINKQRLEANEEENEKANGQQQIVFANAAGQQQEQVNRLQSCQQQQAIILQTTGQTPIGLEGQTATTFLALPQQHQFQPEQQRQQQQQPQFQFAGQQPIVISQPIQRGAQERTFVTPVAVAILGISTNGQVQSANGAAQNQLQFIGIQQQQQQQQVVATSTKATYQPYNLQLSASANQSQPVTLTFDDLNGLSVLRLAPDGSQQQQHFVQQQVATTRILTTQQQQQPTDFNYAYQQIRISQPASGAGQQLLRTVGQTVQAATVCQQPQHSLQFTNQQNNSTNINNNNNLNNGTNMICNGPTESPPHLFGANGNNQTRLATFTGNKSDCTGNYGISATAPQQLPELHKVRLVSSESCNGSGGGMGQPVQVEVSATTATTCNSPLQQRQPSQKKAAGNVQKASNAKFVTLNFNSTSLQKTNQQQHQTSGAQRHENNCISSGNNLSSNEANISQLVASLATSLNPNNRTPSNSGGAQKATHFELNLQQNNSDAQQQQPKKTYRFHNYDGSSITSQLYSSGGGGQVVSGGGGGQQANSRKCFNSATAARQPQTTSGASAAPAPVSSSCEGAIESQRSRQNSLSSICSTSSSLSSSVCGNLGGTQSPATLMSLNSPNKSPPTSQAAPTRGFGEQQVGEEQQGNCASVSAN